MIHYINCTAHGAKQRRYFAAINRFRSADDGAIALIFALVSVVLFASVGGAIDFANAYRSQSLMQNTMDAAILAAARAKQVGATDAEAIAVANNYMRTAQTFTKLTGSYSFEVTQSGTSVNGTANLGFPSTFLHVIGLEAMSFKVDGEARFGNGAASETDVELVMMLDVTGSMAGSKIEDLKVATQDLIEIVIAEDQSKARSRVGMVPFAESVKLDSKAHKALFGKDAKGPRNCVVERIGRDALTDSAPNKESPVVSLDEVDPGRPCRDGREIFPLTNKKSDLKKIIKALDADGSTAGHIGTAWAWYLLSPNWADLFDDENQPSSYADLSKTTSSGDKKLRKIAVLMTDGEYNTSFNGADPVADAETLCANIKASGIEIYSVGFGLNEGSATEQMLKSCASDASKYYRATTGDALKSAFRDIALQATPLRISK